MTDARVVLDDRGVLQLIDAIVAQLNDFRAVPDADDREVVQSIDARVVLDVRCVVQLIDFRAVLVVGEVGLAEASVDRNWGPLISHFLIGINF